MTHLDFFNETLNKMTGITPGTYAAFVSQDGLVLHSNVDDEFVEKQLGSFASEFLDHGKKIFSIPLSAKNGQTRDVQTAITVGSDRVFVITPFLADPFLVIVSPDTARI
ncbi:MAG: hypothetical protein KDC45_15820, partial [Bacteroidetes bacterium]|nr:hypothetical protein [Bacteroidota bacterium]